MGRGQLAMQETDPKVEAAWACGKAFSFGPRVCSVTNCHSSKERQM
jgi:hypothetical protein